MFLKDIWIKIGYSGFCPKQEMSSVTFTSRQDPLELQDQRPGERRSMAPRVGLAGDGRCGDRGSGLTGPGTRQGTGSYWNLHGNITVLHNIACVCVFSYIYIYIQNYSCLRLVLFGAFWFYMVFKHV